MFYGCSSLVSQCFSRGANASQGRGDSHGSWRLAVFIFVCVILEWLLIGHHGAIVLYQTSLLRLGSPLYNMVIVWVFYMALEPYVRRGWPQSLISWTRVLSGSFRDPMVAGHALFGLALGIGMQALFRAVVAIYSQHGE